ncbi:hypothetical protein [Streptomyces sp. ODS28]
MDRYDAEGDPLPRWVGWARTALLALAVLTIVAAVAMQVVGA